MNRILPMVVGIIALLATLVFGFYAVTVPPDQDVWISFFVGTVISAVVAAVFIGYAAWGKDPFR